MTDQQLLSQWQERITMHYRERKPLHVVGSNSKAFYGRQIAADEVLHTTAHCGIVHYEPSELVITARSGTTLKEIESTLAAHHQCLAFEPPHFGAQATLGGCIASGLSGPRRAYSGSARDYVLGAHIINGKGELLRFGGQVMKNVAGYDVSRLFAGSLGTLGVITEVSLKVLPQPGFETTRVFELSQAQAVTMMQDVVQKSLPVSGSCFYDNRLYIRLSGGERTIAQACQQAGGDALKEDALFWRQLKEQQLPFFKTQQPLWRISVPPATQPLNLGGKTLIEWGGAQRWWVGENTSEAIFSTASAANGHATLFRGGNHNEEVFQPLHGKLMELHINTKLAFDPHSIFNTGRMYSNY